MKKIFVKEIIKGAFIGFIIASSFIEAFYNDEHSKVTLPPNDEIGECVSRYDEALKYQLKDVNIPSEEEELILDFND